MSCYFEPIEGRYPDCQKYGLKCENCAYNFDETNNDNEANNDN